MNQHGLQRNIPEEVKREIRQRCNFGCVICGLGLYQYEHVDPLYINAKEHNPKNITLLCPNCHSKVTRGTMAKGTVSNSMQNPYCRSSGFSREFFDIGQGHPIIIFAGSNFVNTKIPIMLKGTPILQISKDIQNGLFFLSGTFQDTAGRVTLRILENEWQALVSNWDVNIIGQKMQIREGLRKIVLEIISKPPDTIIISKLKMLINGLLIEGDSEQFTISNPLTGQQAKFSNCISSNCNIGFSL